MNDTTERLYRQGKMPFWIYAQLNGKSAQENYNLLQEQRQAAQDQQKEIEKQVAAAVDKAMREILETLKFAD